jgi:hypothetical protein
LRMSNVMAHDHPRRGEYRVCDGNAAQYLIVNVGAGQYGGRNVYGPTSQVKGDWVRVWAEKA